MPYRHFSTSLTQHLFVQNSTVDLDNIVTKGMSVNRAFVEDKLVVFDNHCSRALSSLIPVAGWWSDQMVYDEIEKLWNPNKRIQDQILQMLSEVKTSSRDPHTPSQRLWLAKSGNSGNFKDRKTIAVLPYSQYTNVKVGKQSNPGPKRMATIESSFPTPQKLYEHESAVVVLFCDIKEASQLENYKEQYPQYSASKVISTPAIVYMRRSKNLHTTQVQLADIVIRDLIYASKNSDKIVCHTADVQCRFLLLLSNFSL